MAELYWKLLFDILDYLAKIPQKGLNEKRTIIQRRSPLQTLKEWKSVLVLRDGLTCCSLACCSSVLLHHVAVRLRVSVARLLPRLPALLFQLLR